MLVPRAKGCLIMTLYPSAKHSWRTCGILAGGVLRLIFSRQKWLAEKVQKDRMQKIIRKMWRKSWAADWFEQLKRKFFWKEKHCKICCAKRVQKNSGQEERNFAQKWFQHFQLGNVLWHTPCWCGGCTAITGCRRGGRCVKKVAIGSAHLLWSFQTWGISWFLDPLGISPQFQPHDATMQQWWLINVYASLVPLPWRPNKQWQNAVVHLYSRGRYTRRTSREHGCTL